MTCLTDLEKMTMYKNVCDSEMCVNIKKLMENIEEYESNKFGT